MSFHPLDPGLRLALSLASPAGRNGRLTVVIFHRVVAESDPLFPGEPDRERFNEICGWMAAWFNVLPLDEAVQRLASGSLPARALSISFDDGYADNHDIAMPVLRAHGLSATFFITSGFLDGGRMWNDTVVESIRGCSGTTLDLHGLGIDGVGQIDLSSTEARRRAVHLLLPRVKYLEPQHRLEVTQGIAQRSGAVLANDLMMTSEQVRAMDRAGMQIGAHTVSHPILARVDDATAREEVERSKHEVEAIIGRRVSLFAYPNGVPGQDYRRRDVEVVRRAGFAAAVSTAAGSAGPATAPHELPRFAPWERRRNRFGLRMMHNLFVAPAAAPE